jgi:RNAse (barnase) inhibitor barstar
MHPEEPATPAVGLPEFTLDGASFDDLNGFVTAITRTLTLTGWGRNLDAFNDILSGGFGTPEDGFILHWTNSSRSALQLGWPETVRYLEAKLTTCHPLSVPAVQADLTRARRQEGQTLFETITEIIRIHGPGGDEAEDNVHLILT